jgi:threonine/homoserine efflux transporter RhtA
VSTVLGLVAAILLIGPVMSGPKHRGRQAAGVVAALVVLGLVLATSARQAAGMADVFDLVGLRLLTVVGLVFYAQVLLPSGKAWGRLALLAAGGLAVVAAVASFRYLDAHPGTTAIPRGAYHFFIWSYVLVMLGIYQVDAQLARNRLPDKSI